MKQHGASGLHQPVPYGAHGVRLAGAGQTESQHVHVTVHEVSFCKPDELLPEPHRRPLVLEGVPRLAGGEPGRSPQPVHPPDPPVLCLLLQNLHQCRKGVSMSRIAEAIHGLSRKRRQPELPAQIPDPLSHRAWRVGVSRHRAPPVSSPSYTPRSTSPDSSSAGISGDTGAASCFTTG